MNKMTSEKTPLLGHVYTLGEEQIGHSPNGFMEGNQKVSEKEFRNKQIVQLKKHIGLGTAVGIIVGNVIGSGIFVSTKGVLENIGSVGATLIMWGSMGVFAMCQALCYAELGSTMPKAGGDYVYVNEILGAAPAFLCAWSQMAIAGTSANAVIARTAATYILQVAGHQCDKTVVSLIGVLIILTFAVLNSLSVRKSTWVASGFSIAKVFALTIIIVTGIVQLINGKIGNFQNGFEGTITSPGFLALSALDGYFSYKGWETVNGLAEEMINPVRDLPRAVVISMLLITSIYVLTNVAYFTVLTPQQLLDSDAVGITFTEQTLGSVMAIVISIVVAISCMGTINGSFLGDPRYLFAAGRNRDMPQLLSMISIHFYTPIPSISVICIISIVYTMIPNVNTLQIYASLAVQLKICLALIALFVLRWKEPKRHRPIKVNILLAAITILLLVTIVVLSLYQDIVTAGIGFVIFLAGLPLYFLFHLCKNRAPNNKCLAAITVFFQNVLLVVPETGKLKESK